MPLHLNQDTSEIQVGVGLRLVRRERQLARHRVLLEGGSGVKRTSVHKSGIIARGGTHGGMGVRGVKMRVRQCGPKQYA